MNGSMSNIPADLVADLFGGAPETKTELESVELSASLFGDADETNIKEDTIDETLTQEEEEVKNVPEPKQEEEQTLELNPRAEMVIDLISSGTWSDFTIDYEGEHYENLEDFARKVDIDNELFKVLVEKQNEHKLSDLEANSIRVDNLDETRANIVKAISLGVDAQSLLNINDNLIEPLKRADLTNEPEAVELIARDLQQKGLEEDYIKYKIQTLVNDGTLTFEAEKVRENFISEFNNIMVEKQREAQELEKQKQEEEKQAKKEFGKELRELEYSDSFRKQAVELLYGKTDGIDNWVLHINSLIKEKPELKADVVHFMLDQEDYLKKKTSNIRRDEKIKSLKTLEIIKSTSKGKTTITPSVEKDSLFSGGITFNQIK